MTPTPANVPRSDCLVIRELIDHAGAIINGQLCDDLQSSPKGEEEATLDQEEINAMFG